MSTILEKAQKEVDQNYDYFKTELERLLSTHSGKFTLISDQKIIDFYNDEIDAVRTGFRHYGEGCFSVQEITNQPIDLGFQSHVFFPEKHSKDHRQP